MNKMAQFLKFILPIDYWENEFYTDWKNGKQVNSHFLKFLHNHNNEIGPKILDIGSGDGRHLLPMTELGFKLTGLELTESGIKNCTDKLLQHNLSATLIKGDFHHLPFKDECFDSAISTQALHYNNWLGAKKSFAEISRVLKSGAFFFFQSSLQQRSLAS
jgi:ubiquinone/menaquinone biosynthesis C-methylase UbiE